MSTSSSNDTNTSLTSPTIKHEQGELEPNVKIVPGSDSAGINNLTKISFAIPKPPEHVKLGDDDAEIQTQSNTSTEQSTELKNEPTESNPSEISSTNNNV